MEQILNKYFFLKCNLVCEIANKIYDNFLLILKD